MNFFCCLDFTIFRLHPPALGLPKLAKALSQFCSVSNNTHPYLINSGVFRGGSDKLRFTNPWHFWKISINSCLAQFFGTFLINNVWPLGSKPKYGAPAIGYFSSSIISPLFTMSRDFSLMLFWEFSFWDSLFCNCVFS